MQWWLIYVFFGSSLGVQSLSTHERHVRYKPHLVRTSLGPRAAGLDEVLNELTLARDHAADHAQGPLDLGLACQL